MNATRRSLKLIGEEIETYYMTEADVFFSIKDSVKKSISYTRIEGETKNITVFLDPNFTRDLMHYYHWLEYHPDNYLEDSSAISAQVFKNPDTNNVIIVARFLIKNVASERTKVHVTTSSEDKKAYYRQNAYIGQSLSHSSYDFLERFGPLLLVGTTHSHPNLGGIGVRPSPEDVADHHKYMDETTDIWLTHIVDPIRGLSEFYYGHNMIRPTVVYLYYPEDDYIWEGEGMFKYQRQSPNTFPIYKKECLYSKDEQLSCDDTTINLEIENIGSTVTVSETVTESEMIKQPNRKRFKLRRWQKH